uniref:Glycoside hydrolase family 76 protein n=2 Tax=Plectus sambesii TaxID=2011161 RepID=A0A914VAG9_9BILA
MTAKWLAVAQFLFLLAKGACSDDRDVNRVTNRRFGDAQSAQWTNYSAALITVLNNKWYSADLMQWTDATGKELDVWNTWNALEAIIDYANYSGDATFDKVFQAVSSNFFLLIEAQTSGNDDAAWAGIALLKAYRKSPSRFYLAGAMDVFAQLVTFWDSTCNGGVWWNLKRTYKNAITNELFLVLAIDLYEQTHEVSYFDWAIRAYNWFMASGMLNSDNLINDGLTDDCANNGQTTWTYNQGVILGGLAGLARIQPQNASVYLGLADRIARAVVAHLTMNSADGRAILKEPVVHSSDGEQFKGVYMRYLGQLLTATTDASAKAAYARFILENADYVWNSVRNNDSEVAAVWIGQRHQPPWLDAIAQTSAVDLMNAAILAGRI